MKCKYCGDPIVRDGRYGTEWVHQYTEDIFSVFCKSRQGQTLGTYATSEEEK